MDVARAASAEEHSAVQSRHNAAGSNPGFADVDGHIGYQMRGRYPLRGRIARGFRRADEPLDEWQGFIPYEQLPAERDPRRGWTGSANNRPATPTYPIPLYGSYADGQRMRRIRALLVDLATPHTALGSHTTGNSGHPASPFYANHTADWLAGRYHPLHMDPATIQSHAAGTFTLSPQEP